MKTIYLIFIVCFYLVSAKYLPNEVETRRSLLWHSDNSESNESEATVERDEDEDDNDNNSLEKKLLEEEEKRHKKELERQEKLRRKEKEKNLKLQEEEQKLAEKLRREEEKRENERRKHEEKIIERQRKVQEKMEREQRKQQERLEKERLKQEERERKLQEKEKRELEKLQEKAQSDTDVISEESLEENDSLDLEDVWKNYVYEKYGLNSNSTKLEKKSVLNKYFQEELGLSGNSTKGEYRQAVIKLIQSNVQSDVASQNALRKYILSHVNAIGIQQLQGELERKLEKINNKTNLLNNVNLPSVQVSHQYLEEKRTLLQAVSQFLSSLLPNWISSETQTNNMSAINSTSAISETDINVSSSGAITGLPSVTDTQNNSPTDFLSSSPDSVANSNSASSAQAETTQSNGADLNTIIDSEVTGLPAVINTENNSPTDALSNSPASTANVNSASSSQFEITQSNGAVSNTIIESQSSVAGAQTSSENIAGNKQSNVAGAEIPSDIIAANEVTSNSVTGDSNISNVANKVAQSVPVNEQPNIADTDINFNTAEGTAINTSINSGSTGINGAESNSTANEQSNTGAENVSEAAEGSIIYVNNKPGLTSTPENQANVVGIEDVTGNDGESNIIGSTQSITNDSNSTSGTAGSIVGFETESNTATNTQSNVSGKENTSGVVIATDSSTNPISGSSINTVVNEQTDVANTQVVSVVAEGTESITSTAFSSNLAGTTLSSNDPANAAAIEVVSETGSGITSEIYTTANEPAGIETNSDTLEVTNSISNTGSGSAVNNQGESINIGDVTSIGNQPDNPVINGQSVSFNNDTAASSVVQNEVVGNQIDVKVTGIISETNNANESASKVTNIESSVPETEIKSTQPEAASEISEPVVNSMQSDSISSQVGNDASIQLETGTVVQPETVRTQEQEQSVPSQTETVPITNEVVVGSELNENIPVSEVDLSSLQPENVAVAALPTQPGNKDIAQINPAQEGSAPAQSEIVTSVQSESVLQPNTQSQTAPATTEIVDIKLTENTQSVSEVAIDLSQNKSGPAQPLPVVETTQSDNVSVVADAVTEPVKADAASTPIASSSVQPESTVLVDANAVPTQPQAESTSTQSETAPAMTASTPSVDLGSAPTQTEIVASVQSENAPELQGELALTQTETVPATTSTSAFVDTIVSETTPTVFEAVADPSQANNIPTQIVVDNETTQAENVSSMGQAVINPTEDASVSTQPESTPVQSDGVVGVEPKIVPAESQGTSTSTQSETKPAESGAVIDNVPSLTSTSTSSQPESGSTQTETIVTSSQSVNASVAPELMTNTSQTEIIQPIEPVSLDIAPVTSEVSEPVQPQNEPSLSIAVAQPESLVENAVTQMDATNAMTRGNDAVNEIQPEPITGLPEATTEVNPENANVDAIPPVEPGASVVEITTQ
ncbi:unnamed protein product [Diatraea saccharalis]|uniref:Uncharacterized protein n=1 Tax=Diatraea saccharalis TaxID=40085 RepID=A0A9N9R394_9NEOP|nr:unnamed protein product [Diatraea saccharalis]